MGVEWDKIGQNNSHALRNLGSFPQTLSAVLGYTALGSKPAERPYHSGDYCAGTLPKNVGSSNRRTKVKRGNYLLVPAHYQLAIWA